MWRTGTQKSVVRIDTQFRIMANLEDLNDPCGEMWSIATFPYSQLGINIQLD